MDDVPRRHEAKIRQLNDKIAYLQAHRDDLLREAVAQGVRLEDPWRQTSFKDLRRRTRKIFAGQLAVALIGLIVIAAVFIFHDTGGMQAPVAMYVILSIFGATLFATGVGAAGRTARARSDHF